MFKPAPVQHLCMCWNIFWSQTWPTFIIKVLTGTETDSVHEINCKKTKSFYFLRPTNIVVGG